MVYRALAPLFPGRDLEADKNFNRFYNDRYKKIVQEALEKSKERKKKLLLK